jgi:hypothetical protein
MKSEPMPNPPTPKKFKTLGVMCCGCYRMMAPDGKLLAGMRTGKGGVPEPIAEVTAEDFAWFSSKEAADEAAKRAGWRTEDREGPNHRCPDCIAVAEEEVSRGRLARRGAYINREDWETANMRTTHPDPHTASIQSQKES